MASTPFGVGCGTGPGPSWLDLQGDRITRTIPPAEPPASVIHANRRRSRCPGLIKDWTEGMQLVTTGGMIELEIPFDLAYGAAGRPPTIPPQATLHFLVELVEVK